MEKHRMSDIQDEGFRIDSPEKASWAMRKYRALAQKRAGYVALAESEKERIAAWEQRVTASVDSQLEFYSSHLEAYAMQQRTRGIKSLEFPDGAIKTRQTGPTFEVDKSTFLRWAEDNKMEGLIRYSMTPDLTAIKTHIVPDGGSAILTETGEVVPGLLPVPERVAVRIEPDMHAIDLEAMEDEDDDI